MTKYVALYCRLSPRPDGGYEGVDVQERQGRDYAASAWPDMPIRVFADAGISAANGDHRPGFEALREAIGRGEVAHVWAAEQSRLERREVAWFQLAAELDAAGIAELHTHREGVVKVRDEVSGIRAVLAAGEVRKLKKRVNDRLRDNAAEGRPPGAHVFGYRHAIGPDGKTYEVIPEQAAAIVDAANKVLDGWSLARVAAHLTESGHRGAHGGVIAGYTVKKMLTNATIVGLRIHQGRVIGRGNWRAILSEDVWYAIRNKLAAPRVVARTDGGTYPVSGVMRSTGRRYLLSGGLAVCGVCHHPLVAAMKSFKNRPAKPYYLCHPKAGGRACVGILGDELEAHVVATLLDELDKPAFLDALAADDHATRRDEVTAALRALDGQRNDLAGMWADQELTADEWRTARRTLAEREQQLRADLAAVPPPVSRVDPRLIRQGWDAMVLDEQREIVGMFVESVTVNKATPGTRAFDPRRVVIRWRQR